MTKIEKEYRALKAYAESLGEDDPADLEKIDRLHMIEKLRAFIESK